MDDCDVTTNDDVDWLQGTIEMVAELFVQSLCVV